MAKTVFDLIKKQNGETFAKSVRNYDNGIFDIPNIVDILKYAGRDAPPIIPFLVSLKGVEIEEQGAYQDPITLLDKAGYDAYYADTLEKQNAIKKYYASAEELRKMGATIFISKDGEGLCTFRDDRRFENYYIINAVRKDVDQIKREDFLGKEWREDEYGTSVLSIQILKKGGFISIKNRYNHTVDNPDNTLNSNPDNIICGLSQSLKNFFGVDFSSQKTCLPIGYTLNKSQIIKYNYEIDNIYFGSDFYMKDGIIHPIDKDKEIMLDRYILNVKDRTLWDPSETDAPVAITDLQSENKGLLDVLVSEFKDKKITISKNKEGGHSVFADGALIADVNEGQITALNLPTAKKIGNGFSLEDCAALAKFSAPELETIGKTFLFYNESLQSVDLPKVKSIGSFFLNQNEVLSELNVPQLEFADVDFLYSNRALRKLNLPNLKTAESHFLYQNEVLSELNVPELEVIGSNFLTDNRGLQRIELPKAKSVEDGFLSSNEELFELKAPELEKIGSKFLRNNRGLQRIELPKVKKIINDFLYHNEILSEVSMPELEVIGSNFLYNNRGLQRIELPKVKNISDNFLHNNEALQEFIAPELMKLGESCLYENKSLEKISLPKVEGIGYNYPSEGVLYCDPSCFLQKNGVLTEFYAPKLEKSYVAQLPSYISNVFYQTARPSEDALKRKLEKLQETSQEQNAPNQAALIAKNRGARQ